MASPVWSDTYPSRVVKFIVPNTTGGPVDTTARLLADQLKNVWRQPVIVENRPGAGGNLGADAVAKAVPDGHTLLFTASGPLVINRSLYGSLPFDPATDLAPVTIAYSTPLVLTTPSSFPGQTVADLVRHARENPGKLNYSTGGAGTPPHLAAEMFKLMAGIDVLHVPYRGGTEMTMAVLKGEVLFSFNGMLVMPMVENNQMKALAVTTLTRSALAPDLPTMVEAGFPGFDVNGWGGLLAPAATPKQIVDKLYADVTQVLADPNIRAKMALVRIEPVGSSIQEFSDRIRDESAYWARLIKSANIKVN